MKHKNRTKNRKIKFSEKDYFEKHYLKDGKGVIPITINKVEDLYMKHDYKKIDLSDQLSHYIEEMAYIVPIEYEIVLEIHSPEIPLEEQARIVKTFKSNYGMDIDDIDYTFFALTIKKFGLIYSFTHAGTFSITHSSGTGSHTASTTKPAFASALIISLKVR